MLRELLKSKLHRAMITDADVEYEGSIEIPLDLMQAADLWAGEKVLVSGMGRFLTTDWVSVAVPLPFLLVTCTV